MAPFFRVWRAATLRRPDLQATATRVAHLSRDGVLLLLSLTALALFAVLVLFSCLAVAGEADDQAELSREARRRA